MRKASPLERYHKFSRDDPVARLLVHYFYPCDYMYRDYQRVTKALARQKRRSPWRASQQLAYLRLWLSTLYAVIEGYQNLRLQHPEVDYILEDDAHVDSLRILRNGTFHYQKSGQKQVQFMGGDAIRVLWADALHNAFDNFFSAYRVSVLVENFFADRPNAKEDL